MSTPLSFYSDFLEPDDLHSAWRHIAANDIRTFVKQAAAASGIDSAPPGIRALRIGEPKFRLLSSETFPIPEPPLL